MRVYDAIDAGSDCDCSADDQGGACGQCERKAMYLNRNRIHFPQCEKTVNGPSLNPRPAGVFSRTRPAGGGGHILPPLPNSRTNRRSEAGEAAIESPEPED